MGLKLTLVFLKHVFTNGIKTSNSFGTNTDILEIKSGKACKFQSLPNTVNFPLSSLFVEALGDLKILRMIRMLKHI